MNKKNNPYAVMFLSGLCLLGILTLPACRTSQVVTTDANGNSVTNTVKQIDTARIASVSKQAATIGTTEVLTSHPDWTPQFQLAANQLHTLATSPSIDLQSILAIAQQLPVKELKSETARLSFEGATLLISAIDVPELPADKLKELQPIAQAIADGITAGIAAAPVPPPKTAPVSVPAT